MAEIASTTLRPVTPEPKTSPAVPSHVSRKMRYLGAATVIGAPLVAVVSYLLLTGLSPYEIGATAKMLIVALNAVLLLLLIAAIVYELVHVRHQRGGATTGSRLHWQIIGWFGLLAVVPAIAVAIVAFVTLERGLDYWFSTDTRTIVETSGEVADAYLREHAKVLRGDLIAMSVDLDRAKSTYDSDPSRFARIVRTQAALRGLPAAFLLDAQGQVLMQNLREPDLRIFMPSRLAIEQAGQGAPVLIAPGATDQLGALIELPSFTKTYLYVARKMDPQVASYRRLTIKNARTYRLLESEASAVQSTFPATYGLLTLIMVLAAAWVGIVFATWLVAPIRRLMLAAKQVSGGNLGVRVQVAQTGSDLDNLGLAFNAMTEDLARQRNKLLAANEQIDQRRRFTEAVLGAVSAGVLSVAPSGTIMLANARICNILGVRKEELEGVDIAIAIPDFATLVQRGSLAWRAPAQVNFKRKTQDRILTVRVTDEPAGRRQDEHGFVVTVDDITDLVAAQRTSAWADVARRIAHEIKNPLTPIQLSAERLKRRYSKHIEDRRDVFDNCTDTIIRQVQDIGRMVDEFSSFARMPKAHLAPEDIVELLRQNVFMMRVGYPDIGFVLSSRLDAHEPLVATLDRRLIAQALTNVLKNAVESIRQRHGHDLPPGEIHIDLRADKSLITIDIEDNGIGLPSQNRERLLEPYMTTREKGTGLGLAIVNRIMEEHGGRIILLDRTEEKPEPAQDSHRRSGQGVEQSGGAHVQLTISRALSTLQDDQENSPLNVSQQL